MRCLIPSGTPVDRCFQALKKQGHSEESAAKICQSQTGTALATGKPPKKDIKSIRRKYRKMLRN